MHAIVGLRIDTSSLLCFSWFTCSTCDMHTGEIIKTAREALNLTQKELGELAGLDHTTVSRIERDVYEAPRRTIKALTDALGLAVGGERR